MKKVLVISDTHGRTANLEKILPKVKPIDYLLHLGDVSREEDYIEVLAECPCCFIAGNNDYFSDLPRERLIKIEKIPIFMAHGHCHYVNARKDMIKSVAKEKGARIALFGHTHVPFCEEMDGVLVANPGSLSLPRQADGRPTYMILWLEENGQITWEQHKVED